jgi:hypothetical protein
VFTGRFSFTYHSHLRTAPSLAMRSGDLPALGGTLRGYPGNIIPSNQISPLAQKALQYLYPAPNFARLTRQPIIILPTSQFR